MKKKEVSIEKLKGAIAGLRKELDLVKNQSKKQTVELQEQKKELKKLKLKLLQKKTKLFLTVFLPLIIGVIGLFLAYQSFTYDQKVAQKSGVFDSEASNVNFGKLILEDGKRYNLEIGFQENPTQIVFHELPIAITNKGEISTNDVSLSFRYYKATNMCIDTFLLIKNTSPFAKIEHDYLSGEQFEFSTYFIDEIKPKLNINIKELIHTETTNMKVEMDSLSLNLEYEKMFDMFYGLPNESTKNYSFFVSKRNESDIQKLLKNRIEFLRKEYKNSTIENNYEINILMTPKVRKTNYYEKINSEIIMTEYQDIEDIKYLITNKNKMEYIIYSGDGEIEKTGNLN